MAQPEKGQRKKMKRLNEEMTANEIYAEFGIPRGMLNAAANSPCPIRVRTETHNGVTRKWYRTSDVVETFECDMEGLMIGVGEDGDAK